MIHGSQLARPALAFAGIGLFILFGYFAEKTIRDWRETSGLRPLLSGRRSSIADQQIINELPPLLKRRVRLLRAVGMTAMIAGFLSASL
jgi:hypothetical protein